MTSWPAFSCSRRLLQHANPKYPHLNWPGNSLEWPFLITPFLRSWWVFQAAEEDQTRSTLTLQGQSIISGPGGVQDQSIGRALSWKHLEYFSVLAWDCCFFRLRWCLCQLRSTEDLPTFKLHFSSNNDTSSFRVGAAIQESLRLSLRFCPFFLLHEGLVLRPRFFGSSLLIYLTHRCWDQIV